MSRLQSLSVKEIFIVDAIGAAVSASFLGLLLPYFDTYFTMPYSTLLGLSAAACIFCFYSALCAILPIANRKPLLRIIAYVNFCYALVTSGLCIYYYEILSIYDFLYFFGEILILIALVKIEINKSSSAS